jgi:type IV pilus assembly protein PilF
MSVRPNMIAMTSLVVMTAITLMAACSSKTQDSNVKNPERASDAEYDIARDLFTKGNARVALDHVAKAISLNEENDKAHYLRAAILLSFCSGPRGFEDPDCRLGEVEKSARSALKYNETFRDAKNLLGQVLINEKKYKEAITILEPLTKDPAYVHPYYAWGNLGWAQVLDGQLDAGIASLRNAVTEPRFCVGHYRLGIGLEKKGDAGSAEQSFTSAIGADPQCEQLQDAWEARGRVRVKLGKSDDAKKDYEKCVEISKETATGRACVRELAKLPASPTPPSNPAPQAPTQQGSSSVPGTSSAQQGGP